MLFVKFIYAPQWTDIFIFDTPRGSSYTHPKMCPVHLPDDVTDDVTVMRVYILKTINSQSYVEHAKLPTAQKKIDVFGEETGSINRFRM